MAAAIEIAQETELQTRLRIISNNFKERHNCISLKIDTHINDDKGINPFGFHFVLDRSKYRERKKQLKRQAVTQWLAWVALVHHKMGLRHLLLLLLMALYVVIGGFVFLSLEGEAEIEGLHDSIAQMEEIMHIMAEDVVNITLSPINATAREERLVRKIKAYYKIMLNIEGRYLGSVWHKAENLDMHLIWSYSSAIFYSLTLFSTIGYGTITCNTWAGRWVSVVYASIGIPIMLLVLGDLGELIQRSLSRGIRFCRKLRNYRISDIMPSSSGTMSTDEIVTVEEGSASEEEEEEEEAVPGWLAILIITAFIGLVSLIVYMFDSDEFGLPGIDYQSSLYFVFISLTTIGLGDVMPRHIQYNPLLALAFLFGLTLASLINSTVYSQLYNLFYGSVVSVESTLERIHRQHFHKEGHRVFRDLEPAVLTLALSFPKHIPRPKSFTITDILFPDRLLTPAFFFGRLESDQPAAAVRFARSESEGREREEEEKEKSRGRKRAPTITGTDGSRERKKVQRTKSAAATAAFRGRGRAPTLGAFGGIEVFRPRPRSSSNTNKY